MNDARMTEEDWKFFHNELQSATKRDMQECTDLIMMEIGTLKLQMKQQERWLMAAAAVALFLFWFRFG